MRNRSIRVGHLLIVAILLCATRSASRAQQMPPSRSASPVTIDFRALTDDGQPVLDLKTSDVALKVDGRVREIRSLDLVRFGGSGPAVAPSALPAPFASNTATEAGRTLFLAIDEDSIATGKEQPLRDAIGQLIGGLSDRDRVGIMSVRQGGASLKPTTDRTVIRSSLGRFVGQSRGVEENADMTCRTHVTVQTLSGLFSSAPDELFTIVFFSAGLAPLAESRTARIGESSGLCQLRTEDFTQLTAVARKSPASMYVVHYIDGAASSDTAQVAGLENVAGAAGATVLRMTGNPESVMSRIGRETSAYYRASFDPDPSERNGAVRRVELRVNRDRVKVSVRPDVAIGKAEATTAVPRDMLRVGTVFRDLPLRAAGYSSRNPGDDKVKIVALFEPLDPSARLTSAMVGLFDEKAKLAYQWSSQPADLTRSPVMAALVVAPGTYRMRVAAADASGRGGTADYELHAEILRADPLKLSALLLGVPQAGSFAPRLQFRNDPAAVGYLEIYGVPKGANISAALELAPSENGEAIASTPLALQPGAAEDIRLALGGFNIAPLPPGDVLVRAIISLDGKPVGRATRTLRKVGQ